MLTSPFYESFSEPGALVGYEGHAILTLSDLELHLGTRVRPAKLHPPAQHVLHETEKGRRMLMPACQIGCLVRVRLKIEEERRDRPISTKTHEFVLVLSEHRNAAIRWHKTVVTEPLQ